jgi:hypothetical protein
MRSKHGHTHTRACTLTRCQSKHTYKLCKVDMLAHCDGRVPVILSLFDSDLSEWQWSHVSK